MKIEKKSFGMVLLCCFVAFLQGSDDIITGQFTVTQIALDLQHAQLDEEDEEMEDDNASIPNQTQGGDTKQ